jgi:hypothetical protein
MKEARERGKRPGALAARFLLAAILGLSGTAGNAWAASAKPPPTKPAAAAPVKKVTTPAQRCTDLEGQFDGALPKHNNASKTVTTAQKLRADGQRLCDAGQHAAGALRLAKALVDLGVKPDRN